MEYFEKTIDIEKAIRSGDNKVLRSLPRFMISLLKKLVFEDEINKSIYRSRHLTGVPFVQVFLIFPHHQCIVNIL